MIIHADYRMDSGVLKIVKRRYLKMLVETGYVRVDGSTSNIRYVI